MSFPSFSSSLFTGDIVSCPSFQSEDSVYVCVGVGVFLQVYRCVNECLSRHVSLTPESRGRLNETSTSTISQADPHVGLPHTQLTRSVCLCVQVGEASYGRRAEAVLAGSPRM